MEQVVQSANAVNPTRSLLGRQILGLKSFPTRLGIVLMMFSNIVALSAIAANKILIVGSPHRPYLFATILGQLGLLGLWVALGMGAFWMRVVAAVFGSYMLAIAIEIGMSEGMGPAFSMAVLAVVNVAVPASLLRLWKGIFVGEPGKLTIHQNGFRFGIRDLMVLTVLIAFLFVFVDWVSPGFPRGDFWVLAVTFGLVNAFIALVACWASLSEKFSIAKLVVFVIVVTIGGITIPRIMGPNVWTDSTWILHAGIQGGVLFASLLLVRWSGFRIVKSVKA